MTPAERHWQRPVQMHVFPLDRRLGKVRRVCDVLEEKHGKDAESYWRSILRGLADQLARAGIPEGQIEDELCSFSDAVQHEFQRRASAARSPRNPHGDDAA